MNYSNMQHKIAFMRHENCKKTEMYTIVELFIPSSAAQKRKQNRANSD